MSAWKRVRALQRDMIKEAGKGVVRGLEKRRARKQSAKKLDSRHTCACKDSMRRGGEGRTEQGHQTVDSLPHAFVYVCVWADSGKISDLPAAQRCELFGTCI